MLGTLLANVSRRYGSETALLVATKLTKAVLSGRDCTAVSLATIEGRLLRRNPGDPLLAALRVCNSEYTEEFLSGMVVLSLMKGAVTENDRCRSTAAMVAGMLLESFSSDEDVKNCVRFLRRICVDGLRAEEVVDAIQSLDGGLS